MTLFPVLLVTISFIGFFLSFLSKRKINSEFSMAKKKEMPLIKKWQCQNKILLSVSILLLVSSIVVFYTTNNNGSATKNEEKVIVSSQEEQAYNFKVNNVEGEMVTLSNKKPTLLYMMAAWCSTCIYEEGEFKKLHEKYGDKIQLITVDVDPNTDTVTSLKNFKDQYGGDWHHVLDWKFEISKNYNVRQLEEVIVISKEQKIVSRSVNPTAEELVNVLNGLGVK